MRHHIFQEANSYSVAVLIKGTSFNKQELQTNYIDPLGKRGIAASDVIAFTLDYGGQAKVAVKTIKEYLEKLLPALDGLGTKYLYVADSGYFKVLAGQSKAEPHHGYALPCKVKGFEHMTVVLGINYQALIYNPDLQQKLDLGLDTLASSIQGTHQELGTGIIHSAHYPHGTQEIAQALESLHQYPHLSCDIEAFSLRFDEAGIGTITFCWDKHNGIAFPVDYSTFISHEEMTAGLHGTFLVNPAVRHLLKRFFETYMGEITFHKVTYDVKVLIFTLWMTGYFDVKGLLEGLEVFTRNGRLHDTRIIAYLSTNSTADVSLSLKSLAHEFAGNWAVEEITDIRKVPLEKLLQYNLVDGLSTNYVKEKYWPIMVQDQQEELYRTLMMPSQKTILQMELTGMPMEPATLQEVKDELQATSDKHFDAVVNSPIIKVLNLLLQDSAWEADYEGRKAKAKNPGKIMPKPKEAFADVAFNPNSGPQLQRLLYEQMGLPVIDRTAKKQPATGAETIEKLINHTTEASYQELLRSLISYGKVSKILNTFIPAFEAGILKPDGFRWLHGWFNLGGTISGRLSSSDPNMQNLPAGSKYGKLIKTIFKAPPGWIFVGADFASLEDRINALLTKDPEKLKVYTDGYDGHCLRAFAYFGDQMPGIVNTVPSINSIADKFKSLRQDSKAPTFALTYQGTYLTLMKNLGWSLEKAQGVEANYHKLYHVSTQWVKDKIDEAAKKGYAEAAFGLRIRVPLLAQTYLGTSSTPKEAEAEARTLGNAISGQSYGLLNSRAMNVVMDKVHASKYRHDILPVAQIHDAGYYLIRDDAETVAFANKAITEAMAWQDLPEIQHPDVKLGAQLDLFWPDWAHPITLPETANAGQIIQICAEARGKLKEAA